MTNKTYQLETIACPSCAAKIEGVLKKTEGIKNVEVLFNSSRVKAEFDENTVTADAIKGKIEKLGYKVLAVK
ncbi:MAG TPA: heavy-metal-associated domain-containing protein [Firmicutes bacterium]|nr:heavy-metal-associated domain-containing protein [Bacillota bacterium]